jgi:hypothetical protein
MLKLLKVFARGIIVTLLLPVIVLVWVLYAVYCIGLFIFMFVKTTIEYFKGLSFNADLPEDIEARKIVLEKEKRDEQAKQMLSSMYESSIAQQQARLYNEPTEINQNSEEKPDFLDEITNSEPLEGKEDYHDDSGSY